MKNIMNQQQIKEIENLITQTKAQLKTWANQIGKYHAQLKVLSQQLSQIKQQITMNENKPKGEPQ